MQSLFDDEDIPPSEKMSPLFVTIDQNNKIKMVLSVLIDGTLAIISMALWSKGCNARVS